MSKESMQKEYRAASDLLGKDLDKRNLKTWFEKLITFLRGLK